MIVYVCNDNSNYCLQRVNFVAAPTLGTTAQTNSAYIKIMMLREDCYGENQFVIDANKAMIDVYTAAQNCFIAATTVNISQNQNDAIAAHAEANAAIGKANTAQAAILAAQPYAAPLSYAEASADIVDVLNKANANLVAANNAMANLDPASTSALVQAGSALASAAADLLESPLKDLWCEREEWQEEEEDNPEE